MTETNTAVGLGVQNYRLALSIGNRPNMPVYKNLCSIQPVASGEIKNIGLQCGNGWRKVFNVYAKLVFSLADDKFDLVGDCENWQAYRDNLLLQPESRTALIFGATTATSQPDRIHIICGKTHAANLMETNQIDKQFEWFDSEFAVNPFDRSIICPYFDYRQLSNVKIDRLVTLIRNL